MNLLKRTLACLLAVLMLVGMLSTSAFAATSFTAGDVNGDDKVNLLDVAIALRLLAGYEYNGKRVDQALFVNGDGVGDLADATMILRKAAGWDVEFIPAAANAEVWQMENFTFSIVNSTIIMMSQNLSHAGNSSLNNRDACLATLINEYQPDVISFQEYRGTWIGAVEGSDGEKVAYLDRDGNKSTSNINNYNYIVNPSATSVMGSDYQGYVQTRADLNQMHDTVANAKKAYSDYLVEVEKGYEVDPLDYAPQIDERLAIYWNTDTLELVDQGRFLINDYVYDDTLPEYRPNPGAQKALVYKNTDTASTTDDYFYNNGNRLTVWVKLKIKETLEEFYVFNVHGPNVDDYETNVTNEMIPAVNIIKQGVANALNSNMDDPNAMSVFITGDFNVDYYGRDDKTGEYCDRPAYNILANAYKDIAVEIEGSVPQGTMRGDDPLGNVVFEGETGWRVNAKPDYFFVYGNVFSTCLEYKVLYETFDSAGELVGLYNPLDETEMNNRKFLSDHFGIYGEFVIT